MDKNIQQSKFSNKQFYSYSIIISIFGAISAIIVFLGHILEVTVTNDLIGKFSADFPDKIRAFDWVSGSSIKNFASSYNWTILLGFAIFVSMLFILIFFRNQKRDGKQKYADLSIILIYFVLSVTINYLHDPISFSRPLNWIMWIAFSAVCGFSSHLFLLHDHLKDKREVDITKLGKDDPQWKSLSLEHSEYQSLIHDLIWISASFGGGLVVTAVLQYGYTLPIEISFSNEFGLLIVNILMKVVLLLVGIIIGVVYQLAYEMHSIVDLIRESKKNKS